VIGELLSAPKNGPDPAGLYHAGSGPFDQRVASAAEAPCPIAVSFPRSWSA
jgi:hypothetical protein